MFLHPALYQISESQQAANILFDRGVLGVVAFVVFGVLVWVYKDGRAADKAHRDEMRDMMDLYRQQTVEMIKIVDQSNNTMQTLINTMQVTEVIQETIKDVLSKNTNN